jgi:hypothetical protein
VFLVKKRSLGKKIVLSKQHDEVVFSFIMKMEKSNIITTSKHLSFISYPFLVPKANGELRLIIDYSHLCGAYMKPTLLLPAFMAQWCKKIPAEDLAWGVWLDLMDAFFLVPLLPVLRAVTAFWFRSKTYVFQVLRMGLYISPYILQQIVQLVLSKVKADFKWVHINDILILHHNYFEPTKIVMKLVCVLNDWGFHINFKKSVLKPSKELNFCGVELKLKQRTYDIFPVHKTHLRDILFSNQAFLAQCLGYLAFWANMIRVMSATRFLVNGFVNEL